MAVPHELGQRFPYESLLASASVLASSQESKNLNFDFSLIFYVKKNQHLNTHEIHAINSIALYAVVKKVSLIVYK